MASSFIIFVSLILKKEVLPFCFISSSFWSNWWSVWTVIVFQNVVRQVHTSKGILLPFFYVFTFATKMSLSVKSFIIVRFCLFLSYDPTVQINGTPFIIIFAIFFFTLSVNSNLMFYVNFSFSSFLLLSLWFCKKNRLTLYIYKFFNSEEGELLGKLSA